MTCWRVLPNIGLLRGSGFLCGVLLLLRLLIAPAPHPQGRGGVGGPWFKRLGYRLYSPSLSSFLPLTKLLSLILLLVVTVVSNKTLSLLSLLVLPTILAFLLHSLSITGNARLNKPNSVHKPGHYAQPLCLGTWLATTTSCGFLAIGL